MRRLIFTLLLCLPAVYGQNGEHWIATWGASQQLWRPPAPAGRGAPQAMPARPAPTPGPRRRFGIPPAIDTVRNQTVRMIARVSMGGRMIRVRLSNALGGPAVEVGGAHIALSGKDSSIVPGSDRVLTCSGRPAATMYAGQTLISDPVSLNVPALANVAVSLYIPGDTGPPTNHRFALHTTYLSKAGNATGQAEIADASTTESYYWLAGIDVLAPAAAGTLVTFGDSITDGDQSTPGSNSAWPSVLAARLQGNKATSNIAVVNAGISGNRVMGNGQSALVRLYQDVLSQPGVRWMTVLEGINDIGAGTRAGADPPLTAEDLIAAFRQIVELAHEHGVKAIGCTITPWGGSSGFNERGEAVREAVNQWIRTSGVFDAVVDFEAATRDARDPKRFRAEVDSPDLLHPGDAGYRLMAEAFDLGMFRRLR